TLVGTPDYLAPEQVACRAEALGPTTDVWGLGVLLYQTLTGQPPFHASTPMDTMMRVLHQEPTAPHLLNPTVPRDLETICLKCLQKDPAKRYASAEQLSDDLRHFLHGAPAKASAPGVLGRLARIVTEARREAPEAVADEEDEEKAASKRRRKAKPVR